MGWTVFTIVLPVHFRVRRAWKAASRPLDGHEGLWVGTKGLWVRVIWEKGCRVVNVLFGMVSEMPFLIDSSCMVLHDSDRLDMQVFEHLIGAPSPNELRDVEVDLGGEHCSGSSWS
jgi:hypothetical protein